jgi:hypothetical protein
MQDKSVSMSENPRPNGKAGGDARAKKLTPEERSDIARIAAAAKWGIPRAVRAGTLNIGGLKNIGCWVLEDERRIISQKSFMDIIQMPGTIPIPIEEHISQILDPRNLRSDSVAEFLKTVGSPVKFVTTDMLPTFGYEGDIIIDFCKAVLYARRARNLSPAALHYADQAERLLVAIGKVGITALIDEATGYQEIRDRKALEALLDRYLRHEFAAWAKRFPDEFYQEIFRLRGWEWKGMHLNRPSCVGRYTSDLVYDRLEVGILHELEIRNPWLPEKKKREGYHHCLLTNDFGVPALAQHLHTLLAIMRGFRDGQWSRFLEFLNVAMPSKGHAAQFLLDLNIADGRK